MYCGLAYMSPRQERYHTGRKLSQSYHNKPLHLKYVKTLMQNREENGNIVNKCEYFIVLYSRDHCCHVTNAIIFLKHVLKIHCIPQQFASIVIISLFLCDQHII